MQTGLKFSGWQRRQKPIFQVVWVYLFARRRSMSIALVLTLARIGLSPIFLLVYLYYEMLGISFVFLPYFLMLLLAISEISDFLDGYLARKRNQVTDLGKLLDPMADSIFRLSVFFTFTHGVIQLPLILVFALFYRDSLVSTLRTLCALRGVTLAARFSGKIKAVVQALSALFILGLMIPYSLGHLSLALLQQLSAVSAFIAALYTLYSGAEYVYANHGYIKKALSRSA